MGGAICLGLIITGWGVFGVYYLWKVIDVARRRWASNLWTPTEGKVITTQMRPHGKGWYTVWVPYLYTVLGTDHERKFTLMETSIKRNAETARDKISETIALRYNPNKPHESIPDVEKIKGYDVVLGLGLLISFLCVAGFIVWVYFK